LKPFAAFCELKLIKNMYFEALSLLTSINRSASFICCLFVSFFLVRMYRNNQLPLRPIRFALLGVMLIILGDFLGSATGWIYGSPTSASYAGLFVASNTLTTFGYVLAVYAIYLVSKLRN
jgi:hypothetical protein